MSSNKPNAGFFTRKEDEAILAFISEGNRYLFCGGNGIWKKAERENICPGRTFWSIKERFRKTIMRNLGKYKLDEDMRKKIVGFAKLSADGKAKLRFELANPEDVTFIYSGKQKDTKDRSDEESDSESEGVVEEEEEQEIPRRPILEKQKEPTRAKEKDTIQGKQTDTSTNDNTKVSQKVAKEQLQPNQKLVTKNIESNANASSSKAIDERSKNTKKKNSSDDNNKVSGPQRRSLRNQTAVSSNTAASPKKTSSPKKGTSPKKAYSPKKASLKGVKKTLTPEKNKKALLTKSKELKALLKNL